MTLPRLAIRRPVAIAMLTLAVLLLGVLSLRRLPIDLLPEIAYPRLVVYTSYRNVAPSEVERFITEPIEQAVSAVPGVERVESVSREGISLVTLRFGWGTDLDFAVLNVRERLDNLRGQLPELASRPVVMRTDPAAEPVMAISVSGRGDLWSLKELGESVIRRRLEQLDGVAQAAVTGGLEREIHVEVDPRRMEAADVTIDQVAQALASANASAPGGTIRRGRYRYSLRTLGEFQTVREIEQVPIRSTDTAATPMILRDIATVDDGFRERESLARFNGREAVGLLIFKESGANTVRVAEHVESVLDQLRREYPELKLEVASSQAGFISGAISNVVQEVMVGGLLAFLVLFLFLRDPRYPIAIALAIPISIVATFALFDAFDVSLNIMTLGGLALGVGLLMDNSIVVIENIFRNRQLGRPMHEAAAVGAEEVQRAIVASTLTTIAVFGPIIYVEGVAGKLFGALSFSVAFALGASILVALTVLPALAARWDAPRGRPGFIRSVAGGAWRRATAPAARVVRPALERFDAGFSALLLRYEGIVVWALDHRGRVIAVSALLLTSAVAIALTLERSVLPDVDQKAFQMRIALPRGTPLEETAALAERLERMALTDEGVDAVFTRVGRQEAVWGVEERESGINTALLDVRVSERAHTEDVVNRLRALMPALSSTVAIQTGEATALNKLLGSGEAELAVRVEGEDLSALDAHARAVADRLRTLPELANVRVGSAEGQPELRVEIDRERTAGYGIDPSEVAKVVNGYMRGVTATEYVDFDRKIDVLVRLPAEQRESAETLRELRVRGVPLRELVAVRESTGPAEIRRVDQRRVVVVHADIAEGGVNEAIGAISGALREFPPPANARITVAGENVEMREAFAALAFAFALALLLVYMILAAEFESFLLPVIILVSVPLGIVGAIVALWITGAGLNAVSLIGIVVLAGIVDNDAVVKVDFINQMRRQGHPVREAILLAGRARMRPIIINSVTAMLGVLPMALGFGIGAELQAPLAIAVFGGLFTATALTLVVVPVIYDVVEEVRLRLRRTGPVERPEPQPAPGD